MVLADQLCADELLPRGQVLALPVLVLFGRVRETVARVVDRLAREAEFAGEVDKLAARLANGATMAISLSKRLLNGSLDQDRNAAFLAEAMAQEIVGKTDDSTEGVMSFLEKRPSNFKGH